MSRPGGVARRRRARGTEAYRRWAYQVRMNYLRLYGTDLYADLGLRQTVEALRTNYRFGVQPMDAARGIRETEVEK